MGREDSVRTRRRARPGAGARPAWAAPRALAGRRRAADTAGVVITPHVLVGALAGRGRPARSAALLGLATHLVLDAVPHTDYSLRGVRGALKLAVDATTATAVMALLRPDAGALAGAAAALAPDVHAQLGPRFLPGQALHRAAHHKRP